MLKVFASKEKISGGVAASLTDAAISDLKGKLN